VPVLGPDSYAGRPSMNVRRPRARLMGGSIVRAERANITPPNIQPGKAFSVRAFVTVERSELISKAGANSKTVKHKSGGRGGTSKVAQGIWKVVDTR
jgi:hypothetical protein